MPLGGVWLVFSSGFKPKRAFTIALIEFIQSLHQPVVFLLGLLIVILEVQFMLRLCRRLQVQQHHPGLGIVVLWQEDALQPQQCCLANAQGV